MRNSAIAAGLALAIAALFALSQTQAAESIKSADGKCYVNTGDTDYHWGDCPKQAGPRTAAVKGGQRAPGKK